MNDFEAELKNLLDKHYQQSLENDAMRARIAELEEALRLTASVLQGAVKNRLLLNEGDVFGLNMESGTESYKVGEILDKANAALNKGNG